MVLYTTVQSSNREISTSLPPNLVAVFVGGTSGIGEYTLKAFAEHAVSPHVYFIGRSQEAGGRIARECKGICPKGEFVFLKADLILMKEVDRVCEEIRRREKSVNFLFLTQGAMAPVIETTESLPSYIALVYYSRFRFIHNLLPQLQAALSLRRVVSVFAATMEGDINVNDLDARTMPFSASGGHIASLISLSHHILAEQAPSVSFIHANPGIVKSGIAREGTGVKIWVFKQMMAWLGPWIQIPEKESGERHLFLGTSARYSARYNKGGVPIDEGEGIAVGTDGAVGSGSYSVDSLGESAGEKGVALLEKFRNDGTAARLWEHTRSEWTRITGS